MSTTKKSSVFPGLALIFIGSIILLHKILPDFLDWRHIYPLILIALGGSLILSVCFKSRADKGAVFPGTILFFIGVISLLNKLYVIDLEVWEIVADYWPVILIIVGASIILGSLKRSRHLED